MTQSRTQSIQTSERKKKKTEVMGSTAELKREKSRQLPHGPRPIPDPDWSRNSVTMRARSRKSTSLGMLTFGRWASSIRVVIGRSRAPAVSVVQKEIDYRGSYSVLYSDPKSKVHPFCRPPAYFFASATNGRGGGKPDTTNECVPTVGGGVGTVISVQYISL